MHAAAHTTPSAGSHSQRSAQALALHGCSPVSRVLTYAETSTWPLHERSMPWA